MPVTLELITSPSDQDLIDLEKIYADYPTELRWVQLQQQLLQTPPMQLHGARFNNRLLAAITTQEQNGIIKLDHLCVRQVTRGRHVARDLLRLLLAQTGQKPCSMALCMEQAAAEKLLHQAGFENDGQHFLRPGK